MTCSVEGIARGVASVDKEQTERNVRKVLKASKLERALATNTPEAFVARIVANANPTYNGEKVNVLNVRKEKDDFYIKYSVGSTGSAIETKLGEGSEFEFDRDFRADKSTLTGLYSDFGILNDFNDFEEFALDIANNPEKLMEVAENLIEADTYHNDEVHNNTLRSQLSRISSALKEVTPSLNVHINNAGEANYGELHVDTNDIYISKGVGGSKSLMEIYVHELYHAVTHFAISSVDTRVRDVTARMEKIRNNFLDNTSEVDLSRMSGGRLTAEQAGAVLDHMSDPETGLHEFVALSMTNKGVMNQLKSLNLLDKKVSEEKPLFYRLLDEVNRLFSIVAAIVTKEPRGDDFSRMVYLTAKLHSSHKKPARAKKTLAIRNLISIFEPVEAVMRNKLKEVEGKVNDSPEKTIRKTGESSVKYAARIAARSLFDRNAADHLGNAVSFLPLLAPEGTIRTSLRDMREGDATQDKVESFIMSSGVIDQKREFIAARVGSTVTKTMSRKLTEEEEVLSTDMVLDTDLSSIYHDYDVLEMLGSKGAITREVKKVTAELESLVSKSDLNFYKAQTDLLSNYMVNHEDHIALLKNADNIAKKVGTADPNYKVSPRVVVLIDELASLKALGRISKEKKLKFKELMEDQPLGVEQLVAFQMGQKDASNRLLFKTPSDKLKVIKGYSVQLTDPDIDVSIAPLSKEKELKSQGYKLVKTLSKHSLDGNKSEMGLYLSDTFMLQAFHRVGFRVTSKARRGTSITESYIKGGNKNGTLMAARDVRKLKERKAAVEKEMMEGNYSTEEHPEDSMLSPVLNNYGVVKDFTYGLNKDIKINMLNMDRKVSNVMGRTAASTYDKYETESFNKKILDLIEEDVEKNNKEKRKIGKNNKEYILVGKNSDRKDIKEFWNILPAEITSKNPDGFMVRRDLMYSYLGYRELSIVDMPGIKQLVNLTPNEYSNIVRRSFLLAEKLWKEIIKITKIDVIIRTPGVFLGNVVSNFLLMYLSGYTFKEITKLKLQGVKELKTYIDGLKKSIELETKRDAGIASAKEIRELNVIKNNLQNSPVKDLVDEGFYTTIIEEIEHGDDTGSYFNKKAKKKLKNVPKVFRDGFDMLYITENTKLFKIMEKGIQASDFAARYAQYHLMVEEGKTKEEAIKAVRDNFINYAKPNSRFVEWANQMGFIMFTKYFTRIQRVLAQHGKTHPMKVFLSILAQDVALGELDTVDDQSIFVKDMGNMFYNPFDNLMRAITPTSAEAVDWLVNGKG